MPLRLHSIVKDHSQNSVPRRVVFCERGTLPGFKAPVNPPVEEIFIFSSSVLETIGIEPTTSALQGQRSPS